MDDKCPSCKQGPLLWNPNRTAALCTNTKCGMTYQCQDETLTGDLGTLTPLAEQIADVVARRIKAEMSGDPKPPEPAAAEDAPSSDPEPEQTDNWK